MKTGRADWDAFIKVGSIPSDEPVFLLRAQNASAEATARHWARLEIEAGTSLAVIEQALQQADHMAAWPVKKAITAEHLAPTTAKQLIYQYGRREWDRGNLVRDQRSAQLTAEIVDILVEMGASRPGFGAPDLRALAELAREVKALNASRTHG